MYGDMTAGTINKSTEIRDRQMANIRRQAFRGGVRDGMLVALGYLAVSFTLGVTIQKAGMTAFQGMLTGLLDNASAGEYVGFMLIMAGISYQEVVLLTLVTNARYLLTSYALNQKFTPGAPLVHRLLAGHDATDEIFSISIARPGCLNPYYNYGTMAAAVPGWTLGTWLSMVVGNILPLRAANTLSVTLYGMFLAVIIPPARNDKVVTGLALLSFVTNFLSVYSLALADTFGRTRAILLAVVIAGAAAVLFLIDKDEVSDKEVQ